MRRDRGGGDDWVRAINRKRASTFAAARRCEELTNGSAASPDSRCSGAGQERQSPTDGAVSNRSAVHGTAAPQRSSARWPSQTRATATSRAKAILMGNCEIRFDPVRDGRCGRTSPRDRMRRPAEKCRRHASSSVAASSGSHNGSSVTRTIRIKAKREDIPQQRTDFHRIGHQQRQRIGPRRTDPPGTHRSDRPSCQRMRPPRIQKLPSLGVAELPGSFRQSNGSRRPVEARQAIQILRPSGRHAIQIPIRVRTEATKAGRSMSAATPRVVAPAKFRRPTASHGGRPCGRNFGTRGRSLATGRDRTRCRYPRPPGPASGSDGASAEQVLGEAREQRLVQAGGVGADTQRIGHERETGARFLVFGDQAQQQAFLEGAGQEQIADLRVVALSIAVDAAVALLQAVRIVGQVQMDQVKTALVQVQPLGQRIGADQDDLFFYRETFRRTRSFGFRVCAADGQDRAVRSRPAPRPPRAGCRHIPYRRSHWPPDDAGGSTGFPAPARPVWDRATRRPRRGGSARAIVRGRIAGQRGGHLLGFQFGDLFFIGACPAHRIGPCAGDRSAARVASPSTVRCRNALPPPAMSPDRRRWSTSTVSAD